ncbi:MAG TPA: 5-(carboxyamino)imidazole ribonucleotide synthase [Gemmatimonadales bacterium]|nr:5-(carboxyamino)imidazole ribonucleotide synthase [Gemmatimonadales bacterium]
MILPGATLGVLGGGQLGRMFALRARVMGYHVVVLEPDPRSPAGQVADEQIEAAYDDAAALDLLAERCAAVTTEFENVPAGSLERLAARVPVHPSAAAVSVAQERIAEKSFLRDQGFATAEFAAVREAEDVERAIAVTGLPAILKTTRLGYDGKGQAVAGSAEEVRKAFARFGGVPCILERRLHLECEISVVLARGADGQVVAFPAGENVHRHGILHTTTVPARIAPALAAEAEQLAGSVAERLAYVGVLGVEMFVADGGRLFVNEIAPRPHNSGHYTIDACGIDQFELQVRAMTGLPLVAPRLLAPVCMVNVLGDSWAGGTPRWERALAMPGVRLHLYGKTEPRPGRKMGHLTCLADSADAALALATAAHAALCAT